MTVRRLAFVVLLSMLGSQPDGRAVLTDDVAVTTEPTVTNWTTGWGADNVTGWDYVGSVGGASGVYLGNGWVLTAAHVGAGDFTLDGITYTLVAGSTVTVTNADGTATDLVLFQIADAPDLPELTLDSSAPVTLSMNTAGSNVVMIGYGGGTKAWGQNMVTAKNQSVTPDGTSYVTTDFATKYGESRYISGGHSVTVDNEAKAVVGDSGGAGFIYDASTGQWELAGIIEAVTSSGDTYLVQLSQYADQINTIRATSAVPESRSGALLVVALLAAGGLAGYRARALRPGNSAVRHIFGGYRQKT